jgi:hypothetical protein
VRHGAPDFFVGLHLRVAPCRRQIADMAIDHPKQID